MTSLLLALLLSAAPKRPPAPPPVAPPPAPAAVTLAVLIEDTSLPTRDAVTGAFARLAPLAPPLSAGPDDKVMTFESGGVQVHVTLVPEPLAADVVERAAGQSLYGFLQDWRPSPHRARLVVSLDSLGSQSLGSQPSRATVTTFLRIVAAVEGAAHAVAVHVPAFDVIVPPEVFRDAVMAEPPLLVGWLAIERRMENARAIFASHGMALLGLPELTLSVPIAKSADALGHFLGLLEQAQQTPPPADKPWRVDLPDDWSSP